MSAMKQNKQKKACFLYYQAFGPLLYREAMALKKAGYIVDVICLRTSEKEKVLSEFEGLRIFKINKRFAAEKNAFGYFWGLFCFFFKALGLLGYLGVRNRYRLVHVTSPPDVMVFAAIVPRMLGARILLDIHDIGPELFMRKLSVPEDNFLIALLKWLEKVSSSFSDHVFTVTDLWRDRLVSRSVPPEKCSVLLNVPDTGIFKFRNCRKKGASETINLYYHGSIEEHFGVDTLLQAMTLIIPVIHNVRLNIYASKRGRMFDKYVSYVNAQKLTDNVTFHLGVPFYELPSVLEAADIGIVPTKNSVFADEALSMKSLEYIFLGIPIVISRTKAHRYYYKDSMVKFFDPCNSADLAKSIIELCKDETLRTTLVHNSKEFIEQNSWEKVKYKYLDNATDSIR